MKKYISIITAIILFSLTLTVSSEENKYQLGVYYQLGKYNGTPIKWCCISTNDENGILMVGDKILCFKAANAGKNDRSSIHYRDIYGNNYWEESTIRTWLNSKADAGNIKWSNYTPDSEHILNNVEIFLPKDHTFLWINNTNFYADEAGFLSQNNFTSSELSVLKTSNQWQALPGDKMSLATNGMDLPYVTYYIKRKGFGESEYGGGIDTSNTFEMKDSYIVAMNRVNDTMFLLDPVQVNSLYEATGTFASKSLEQPSQEALISDSGYYGYWLRTPSNNITSANWPSINITLQLISEYGLSDDPSSAMEYGIRPGFYLNESTAQIKFGSGTENDPYILDGTPQDGITVFSNGEQLNFEQQPLIENDHTLVGMRAVFESLGADVSWTGENKTVTAVKNDTTIQLQVDNNIMQVNNDTVELETPARLVNDNTMVPVRAVSEALDARVEWIEDLQRVVVDEQPEWVESDWNPDWYQDALSAGSYTVNGIRIKSVK